VLQNVIDLRSPPCASFKQIKSGEKITYYRGDISKDLETSAAVKLGSEEPDLLPWTGAYVEMFRAVRRTAAQLARDRLVALSVTEHTKTMKAQRKRKGESVTEVNITTHTMPWAFDVATSSPCRR
jgi:hypothetical protein